MGLSRSKHTPRKGEEQKKAATGSVPKPKDKLAEKRPQEARQAEREGEKPADPRPGADAAKHHQQPSASGEGRGLPGGRMEAAPRRKKPDAKQKSSRKRSVIPQIIITRASNETLNSIGSSGSEEPRTIREHDTWGPYHRHRNPSTVDAYNVHTKE
ncbi:spermatogenesis-associated protein 33 isoform X2 [Eulemur rufifrons]|uniref:spermatogenesis-associated protein 33 isoform X2 n=1 Tax=Eulemur rufifrons TaxID=859984 RepID=UPI0037430086